MNKRYGAITKREVSPASSMPCGFDTRSRTFERQWSAAPVGSLRGKSVYSAGDPKVSRLERVRAQGLSEMVASDSGDFTSLMRSLPGGITAESAVSRRAMIGKSDFARLRGRAFSQMGDKTSRPKTSSACKPSRSAIDLNCARERRMLVS